jgi:hypothetical protein
MRRTPTPAVRAIMIASAVTVVLGLLVTWFAWPAKELEPRGLPVVVAGPAPAAQALAQRLEAARPGAFDVTTVADAAAADAALRDREAYAAFVLGAAGLGGPTAEPGTSEGAATPGGISLHIASAASPTVSALLTQATQQLAGPGQAVAVVDVVPGSPDDPRGAGFASGFLPLVLAGMVVGILLAVLVESKLARLIGLLTFAPLAGLVGAGVMAGLGVTDGAYLSTAAAVTLLALAVSATVAGLASLLGPGGIGLGVLVVFLFGNPIAGVNAAPELLPRPWGLIGQLLPPGAGAQLVRSAAFFDWAGSAAALWTLVVWALGGLALLWFGRARIAGHTAPAAGPAAGSAVGSGPTRPASIEVAT